jgi:peptidoglycan-associated lipoprotein
VVYLKHAVSVAAIALALAACSPKKEPVAPPIVPPERAEPAQPAAVPQQPAEVTPGRTTTPGTLEDLIASAGSDRVFFAYDSSDLDSSAQSTLRSEAEWLKKNASVRITIEGHCDERGTREYNLALGERRASAVKSYLVSLGVTPSRVSVVSYGRERPELVGSDDESYAKNRRGVTVIN